MPQIDEIIETTTEITVRRLRFSQYDVHEVNVNVQNAVGATMRIQDCEEKKAARAKLCSGTLPKYLAALEKILEKNGSTGKGFCSAS